jgi:hypothetical protein
MENLGLNDKALSLSDTHLARETFMSVKG